MCEFHFKQDEIKNVEKNTYNNNGKNYTDQIFTNNFSKPIKTPKWQKRGEHKITAKHFI